MATRKRRRPAARNGSATDAPDAVEVYARDVIAGRIVAGPFVRLACERHLRDLTEGPARGLKWDWPAAERAISFFPGVLRLAEGEFAGKPFELQPWQKFIVGSLFGWKAPDGSRRFRIAYVEIGKGNGKSPLAAGVALYMLIADGEAAAEVYAAAVTRDQAGILFQDAVKMVEAAPMLCDRIQSSGRRKVFNLAHLPSQSFFRPISSEGRGLDGKRVHFAAIDEVHEHPSAVVVEKMRLGTKGRRQALIFLITNSGYDRETVCWYYHEYSGRVLGRTQDDDALFAFVCGLDERDDWRDEKVWPKANPNLGVSVQMKYLREIVREAIGMPAKQNLVRRLNFCEWTESESAWIGRAQWSAVEAADLDVAALAGRECWGGLDLSGKRDLTALALVFPEGDGFDALAEFWTPDATIRERELSDRVPYSLWRDQGHLTATPGAAIDHDWVADRIAALADLYDLRGIAFDPYQIEYLAKALDAIGCAVKLIPHPQGYRKATESALWMPGSIDRLETLIVQRRLRVAVNPALRSAVASVRIELDAQGNKKFTKRRSTGRIDGAVALAMAIGVAESGNADEGQSFWETQQAAS